MQAEISVLNQPDPKLLGRFAIINKVCLLVTLLIGIIILSGWTVPDFGSLLPDGWAVMQSSTALSVLFLSVSVMLTYQKHDRWRFVTRRLCASAAIFLAVMELFVHLNGSMTGIGALWVLDSMLPMTHPMSIQSATCFVLLGLSLEIKETRQDSLGRILDMFIIILVILNLVFIAAYVFGASYFVGHTEEIRISPQTLVCTTLLTFVLTNRRAPYGMFATLVSAGIGGHFARIMLPVSVAISYLILLISERLLSVGILSLPYAAALTAAIMAILLIIVVILMAGKINALERVLHNISITDELTGLYNRRGFYLLGEQALSDAYRSNRQMFILFFDVDGLKEVNDTLGHEVGSRLLLDMATLLRKCFRHSDILGRVGGDEFAVIAHGTRADMNTAIARLNDMTRIINKTGNKPYTIGFSSGSVMIDLQSNESLDELLDRADKAMYKHKREKRIFA
ncbi:MAG: GGDEF domain-containing protein [Granulosicoccaceae bacterium]|jgi:diguanylate cyclase (GGDEF)-like protein